MIDCMIETMQCFQKEKLKILKRRLSGEGKKNKKKKSMKNSKSSVKWGGPN